MESWRAGCRIIRKNGKCNSAKVCGWREEGVEDGSEGKKRKGVGSIGPLRASLVHATSLLRTVCAKGPESTNRKTTLRRKTGNVGQRLFPRPPQGSGYLRSTSQRPLDGLTVAAGCWRWRSPDSPPPLLPSTILLCGRIWGEQGSLVSPAWIPLVPTFLHSPSSPDPANQSYRRENSTFPARDADAEENDTTAERFQRGPSMERTPMG